MACLPSYQRALTMYIILFLYTDYATVPHRGSHITPALRIGANVCIDFRKRKRFQPSAILVRQFLPSIFTCARLLNKHSYLHDNCQIVT